MPFEVGDSMAAVHERFVVRGSEDLTEDCVLKHFSKHYNRIVGVNVSRCPGGIAFVSVVGSADDFIREYDGTVCRGVRISVAPCK